MNAAIRKDSARYRDQAPRERILVAAENAALARTLATLINRFGGKGIAVWTVPEVIERLATPDTWAGIILDLRLCDELGVRLLEWQHQRGERGRDVPVLILTKHANHPSGSAADNLRSQFLDKPAAPVQIEHFFRFVQQDGCNRRDAETAANSVAKTDPRARTCAAAAILHERRMAAAEALRSFWRIGDLVVRLRADTEPGRLRAALAECAISLGVHPSWLDSAARAALGLSGNDKRMLVEACRDGRSNLTPSHIAELARARPRSRREGIAALLCADMSVRELRERLRD